MRSFRAESEALREQMIAWRRDFHQHPELAFEEVRTSGIVAEVLNQLGLEVQRGIGKTGVVGILEGAKDGPTVLVRADMDALPIIEANDVPYVSQTLNKMHACGHDSHTAIALGVATIFAKYRQDIAGRIKFVFQPAEEIGGGAKAMIMDGVMHNPTPDVALGLHVWNDFPLGNVVMTDGPQMAGADKFRLVIRGRGGHAAHPHQTHDPVVAAAQIISAAQTIVSRNVSPLETAVVSFSSIHGGDTFNVIPEQVEIHGTVRTYTTAVREQVLARLEAIIHHIATGMQCEAVFENVLMTPSLINDTEVAARLRAGFSAVEPQLQIRNDYRTMGAEDMAYFLEQVPGVYFFVGSANAERGLNYPHHHPRFDIDEDVIIDGASLLAAAIGDYVLSE